MKVKVNGLECKRCNHKWIPRKPEVMLCPKCHSPFWNKEVDKNESSIADELDKKMGITTNKETASE